MTACLTLFLISTLAAEASREDSEQRLHRVLTELPELAVPLFVVGDIDESGSVDEVDRALLQSLLASQRSGWSSLDEASCPAAGDLTLDGAVEPDDLELLDSLLDGGEITRPFVYFQAGLPCAFDRLFLAVESLTVPPGGNVRLWILDLRDDHESIRWESVGGGASVRPGERRDELIIEPPAGGGGDDLALRLDLGALKVLLFLASDS